jgi:hypothetical protein
MADLGCRLERPGIEHPDGERLAAMIGSLVADERVVVTAGGAVRLRATIATPQGRREFGRG